MTSQRTLLALTAAPGVLAAVLALGGWTPTVRDLPEYFFPLRQATAEALAGDRSPFWLRETGCGEPFFANPQSALLYPGSWLALVLPAHRAVGMEIGLHLALLGLGTGLLARTLGARGGWLLAAGWGAALAGPVLDSAGVLNNLTTLTWLPWLWRSAVVGSRTGMAAFLALAWLGAEPQLACAGAVVGMTLGHWRRTLPAMALGGALVAIQALPFLCWVLAGDRTLAPDAERTAAGALTLAELPALLFPGLTAAGRPWRFVLHPTLALWAPVLAGWGLLRGEGVPRRLACWGVGFLGLALVPALPGGEDLWVALSGGLVRYPGRWLFLMVLCLVPAAAAVGEGFAPRRLLGAAAGILAWGLAVQAGAGAAAAGLQAVALGTVLAWGGTPAAAAAVVAAAALGPAHLQSLGWVRGWTPPAVPCLEIQQGPFRVYPVEYSAQFARWLGEAGEIGSAGFGLGYQPLLDGRLMTRSYGPLSPRSSTLHLQEADRGPAGRWWLDALGAARMVSFRPVAGFPVACRARDLLVLENPRAWPLASVTRRVPLPGEAPEMVGSVTVQEEAHGRRRWLVEAAEAGFLVWLETPDRGWRAWVAGAPAQLLPGPGIVQAIAVRAGTQTVEVRYRPPGFVPGLLISLAGLGGLVGVLWRRW